MHASRKKLPDKEIVCGLKVSIASAAADEGCIGRVRIRGIVRAELIHHAREYVAEEISRFHKTNSSDLYRAKAMRLIWDKKQKISHITITSWKIYTYDSGRYNSHEFKAVLLLKDGWREDMLAFGCGASRRLAFGYSTFILLTFATL